MIVYLMLISTIFLATVFHLIQKGKKSYSPANAKRSKSNTRANSTADARFPRFKYREPHYAKVPAIDKTYRTIKNAQGKI